MTGLLDQSAGRILATPVAVAPWNDRLTRVWGTGLTPQSITSVFRNADLGYLWYQADLLEEIRGVDTHLSSVLQKRELQVAGAEWEIRPPEGSGPRAKGIADWCRDRLQEITAVDDLGRSFNDGLADLLGGIYHGRGILEAIWRQDGRYWYPERLEFVHPRRCAYATDWRLHLWDALGTHAQLRPYAPADLDLDPPSRGRQTSPFGVFPGLPVEAFPAGKFVVHRPRIRGTYPTREGLGRILSWYSCFKRFSIRDWLAYVEWAGRGLRIGQYMAGGVSDNPTRATPADQEALESAIENLSSAVSAIIPDTTKIEIRDAPSTNNVHDQLTTFCNLEMSKAVLGETLTTEVGTTGGNRALGDVHDDVRLMIAKADAKALADTIRRDLLGPMIRRSFGPRVPVPSIVFAVAPSQDLDALAKRIASLVKDAGLRVGQDWLREVLGIPTPTQDEETLQAAAPGPTHAPLAPTEAA